MAGDKAGRSPVQMQLATGQIKMTAVQHKTMQPGVSLPSFDDAMPLLIGFKPNWHVRVVIFRVVGTALVLGAAGMWLMPGSQGAADLVLMKLGMSVFFLFCGLALLMINHADNQPDAYFDPIRREVRILKKCNRGRPRTVLRRSYDSIGSVRFEDHTVELFGMDGSRLMELPMENAEIRHALRMQLCGQTNISN